MTENIKKKNIWLVDLFLGITVYILSGSIFMTTNPGIRNIILVGVAIMLPSFFSRYMLKKDLAFITGLFLFCSGIIVIGSMHGDNINTCLMLSCVYLFSYGIALRFSFNEFVAVYIRCVTIISSIDLVLYLVLQYVGDYSFFPIVQNTNFVTYRMGYIFNYISHQQMRNCGVFWEPGLYATILVIAFILELVFVEKKSTMRIILYHVCIITTLSAAGLVLMLLGDLLLLNEFLKKVQRHRYTNYIVFFFLFIILVGLLFNSDNILNALGLGQSQFYGKLLTGNISDSMRVNAIKRDWGLFSSSPLFGVGVGAAYRNALNVDDTATTLFAMAEFGIIGLVPTLVLVLSVLKLRIDYIQKIIVLVCLLFCLNKEPHSNIVIIWILTGFFSILGRNRHEDFKGEDNAIVQNPFRSDV